ncbi:hypothetical protein GCM10010195_21900 [Kitasatospora griseola]|nr:hypothetical protein GCM10010195_21900 [Kitasatospora griseola]
MVVTEIDQAVEGKAQLVVLQEVERHREIDAGSARQAGPSSVEVATSPAPAGLKCLTVNGHGASVAGAVRRVT